MKKLLRNRKALSPVVAAIILIAVTVAVSIAVAAWMGSLTFSFMGGTEELKILDVKFDKATSKLSVEVTNIGTEKVTISDIRVDGVTYKDVGDSDNGACDDLASGYELDKGANHTFVITFTSWPFKSGVKYTFLVLTTRGNQFQYTATSPS